MELILASASPRRKEILRKIGISFRHEQSHVKEEEIMKQWIHQTVEERVKILSQSKAEEVAKRYSDGEYMVLGADTVVVMDGEIFGKPHNPMHLLEMIKTMSGKTHQVLTAVSMVVPFLSQRETIIACTEVTFRHLNEQEIDWYVNHAHYMDKAGGYAIQEEGAMLVESIHGCYYNVVGLPISELFDLFQRFGYSFLDFQQKPTIKIT